MRAIPDCIGASGSPAPPDGTLLAVFGAARRYHRRRRQRRRLQVALALASLVGGFAVALRGARPERALAVTLAVWGALFVATHAAVASECLLHALLADALAGASHEPGRRGATSRRAAGR